MKRYIIYALMVLVLGGCRYSFDLKDSGLEPKICVMAVMAEGEETGIRVCKTVPVYEVGKADAEMAQPRFTLLCNGKEVEAGEAEACEDGYRINAEAFRSGDLIELRVEAEGLEAVAASTVIPEQFPPYTQEMYQDEDRNYCVRVTYEDDPETRDYYGAVVEYRTYMTSGELNPHIHTAPPLSWNNEISIDPDAYAPAVIQIKEMDHDWMFIWKDEDGENSSYEMKIHYESYGNGGKGIQDTRIRLYRLSEEMYRRLYAQYDIESNPFAGIGMSSPSFTYNNIKGGVGWFCSYSSVTSEWMLKDKEEESL